MRIEDAEQVFGKRWNLWDEQECREFVSVLTEEELKVPGCLKLLVDHLDAASPAIQMKVALMLARGSDGS